jgi:hypothetical protein
MAISTAMSAADSDECRRRCGILSRGHVAHSGLSTTGLSAKQCHERHGGEDYLLLFGTGQSFGLAPLCAET